MNFKCVKLLIFFLSILGTVSIFFFYSKRDDFLQNSVIWRLETSNWTVSGQNRDLGAEKIEKSGSFGKNHSNLVPLSSGVHLKLNSSKDEFWSTAARDLIDEELRWNEKEGSEGELKIPIYVAECSPKSKNGKFDRKRTKSPAALRFVEDSISGQNGQSISVASLPCMLFVNKSIIYGAGRGVFTKIALPRGLIFGRYKGEYVVTPDESYMARRSYAWALGVTYDGYLYVDAKDEDKSNWLRFVNCARFEEEQNLYPIFVEGEIYYFLYKNVPAGTELLIWYGRSYGAQLGIWFLSNATATGLAAPRSQMVCPTCRGLPRLEDVERWERKLYS